MTAARDARTSLGDNAALESSKARKVVDGTLEVVNKYFVALVVTPLLAGAVAFAFAGLMPKQYTSTAYLRIDENAARAADALLSSDPVLDMVLAKVPRQGDTVEARRRLLDRRRTIRVAKNEIAKSSLLFRLEVTDQDPRLAHAICLAFIDAWLEATKPAPGKRIELEHSLARAEEQIKWTTAYIDRLEKENPGDATAQYTSQGKPAGPLVALLSKRDEAYDAVSRLQGQMTGFTRDTVFGEPTIPEEPSGPNRLWIAVLAAAAAELLLLGFLLLRRAPWLKLA